MNIVVLTGAGISAESGIKTFRDNNGLWESHSIQEVATPEGFNANPDLVFRFYNQRRQQLFESNIQPNNAHFALSELEKEQLGSFTLITQNVDNLHERAGSKNILHMHGELINSKCPITHKTHELSGDFTNKKVCTCCHSSQVLRPNIVWFGETPYYMEQIEQAIYEADIFLSIGTSGHVYPAAGFVSFANECGAQTIELNLEPSKNKSEFQTSIIGKASKVVPEYVRTLLKP